MNDPELDELLDRWQVPSPSLSARDKVWRAFRVARKPFSIPFRPMFAGTALGAILCMLLLITQAFPQTIGIASPWFRIPFTVDSEVIDYEPDGSSKVDITYTSYLDNGQEIILSSTMPGRPAVTAVRRVLEFGGFLWQQIAPRPATSIDPGCVYSNPVKERVTILGYPTLATTTDTADAPERVTFWYAPDLNCFALKIRFEERQPDGSYRVFSEKHALSVTRRDERQSSR